MSPSRTPRKAKKAAGAGGRLQTVGLFLAIAAVSLLLGSLAWGAREYLRHRDAAAPPVVRETADPRPSAGPAGRVRVEVLNASGRPGLAKQATELLRDRGFDVVNFGNAQGFAPDSSLVLDRVGKPDDARLVADAAGIARVQARPDATLYLDVTVVLGRDWRAPAGNP